jgi:hypothetical protein
MKVTAKLWKQRKLVYVLLVVIVTAISGIWFINLPRATKFSVSVWKVSSAEQTRFERKNPRRLMVEDLRDHYITNGISRASVLSLLGPADLPNSTTDNQLWYYLGHDFRLGKLLPPSLYLVLDFTPDGLLKERRIESPD